MSRSTKPSSAQTSGSGTSKITLPLAERAYIDIKRMILSHELPPGSQINVAQLSEHLNLGRNPIHMAIHRLDREGLVEILPRKGILVKAETLNSFLDLIQSRLLIEPWLAGQAAEYATAEQLLTLRELVEAGQAYQMQHNRTGAMEIDRLFHRALYQMANNQILADFAEQLLDRSLLLWLRPQFDRPDSQNADDLEALYDAVASGDKIAATQAMQKHIEAIQQNFMKRA
ncbi:MAG: GntR family transcriptional regulator [Alcaligenaceae bacterium]|nr:GntR family transcriptional regulator [Alcaligenaceae bacterium]